jgi:putative aldouronate transport system permease protein
VRERAAAAPRTGTKASDLSRKLVLVRRYRFVYLLMAVGIAYFLIFRYVPMYGVLIAFKDYKFKLGIMGSPWVGLKHFSRILSNPGFYEVLRNTFVISFLRLICGFPMPIVFALLLNELSLRRFKKTVQTISYLPHFLSWVVLGGIFAELLSPARGVSTYILKLFGLKPIYFLADAGWARIVVIVTGVWQGVGYGSVIYLASIASIDQEQYEAAYVDGASRWQQAVHITLPSIAATITILLILSMGGILNAGFDQIFNLYNALTYETLDILDTYVYRRGLIDMDYSFSTAVGLFKNVVGLCLMLITNSIVKRLSGSGIW